MPDRSDLPADFPYDKLLESGGPIYRAAGCRSCRGTGYSGRVGIYELLETTDEVRELAANRSPSPIVKKAAIAGGMRTLRQDGWQTVLRGKTTVEEVLRVSKSD